MTVLHSELSDRKLRYDGVSEVQPDDLTRFLLLGVPPSKLRTAHETPEVTQFNEQVPDEDAIRLAGPEPVDLDLTWQLPQRYLELDLNEYFIQVFLNRQAELAYSFKDFDLAIERIAAELQEVQVRGMEQFIRAVIYILDEFRAKNVVWGVGRGSSCASYLLFLIGLHVVDCCIMEVPMQEFFHS